MRFCHLQNGWDVFTFKMNIISIRKRIAGTADVSDVTCMRQNVITRGEYMIFTLNFIKEHIVGTD